MTKETRMTNDEETTTQHAADDDATLLLMGQPNDQIIHHSGFVILSSLGISSFVIGRQSFLAASEAS